MQAAGSAFQAEAACDRQAPPRPSPGHASHWPRPPQVHDYLRSKLCSLYENDCIFDKFECAWNGSDR